ncbi:hypothetical protein BAE46_00920 [Glaciecola punicea]|uniref:hypothetical protein n=1 Tax=Glaciecola punicea TaxID=56804 RepID=UPI0008727A4D|nr:hypothetical protein [Glaciecola punicea]OFA33304.1 hypothetical protein BAE46_00920 [Glaciecola punicea]
MSERKWQKEIQAWLDGDELQYLTIPLGWVIMDVSKNHKNPITCPEYQWRIRSVNPRDLAAGNYLAGMENEILRTPEVQNAFKAGWGKAILSTPQVRNAFRAGWDKAIESIT